MSRMLQKSSHLVVQPLYQTVRQTSPQVQKIRQKTMTRKIPAVEALLQPNQFQPVRVTKPEVVVRAPPAVNHIVQNHPQGSPLPKVVLRNQLQPVQAEVVRVTRTEVIVRAPPAVNHTV